jgi:hypothetical protein
MLKGAPSAKGAMTLQRRVLLLGACIVAGCLVGAIGHNFFDSSAWFLAVPAFIAVAWLFVANPNECLPHRERASRDDSAAP